jgi:6-phosphogluconate dehydrogenase (decarboxylating)
MDMVIHIGFVGSRCRPLVTRLAQSGYAVAWHAQESSGVERAVIVADAVALARALAAPRVAWLDLPTGFATELAIQDVWPEFAPGDVIVDAGGGNEDDGRRRAASLASAGIRFVDCCVRWPAGEGAPSLFMGGEDAAIRTVAPYADLIAGEGGWSHCGPAGSGYHGGANRRASDENAA